MVWDLAIRLSAIGILVGISGTSKEVAPEAVGHGELHRYQLAQQSPAPVQEPPPWLKGVVDPEKPGGSRWTPVEPEGGKAGQPADREKPGEPQHPPGDPEKPKSLYR